MGFNSGFKVLIIDKRLSVSAHLHLVFILTSGTDRPFIKINGFKEFSDSNW